MAELASAGAGALPAPRAGRLAALAVGQAVLPLACLVLAVLSVGLQGFQVGVDNNVFHLPIVLRWYDLAQFADDPVIQSLRRYQTPVFIGLGWITDAHNVEAVFLAAHLATRALTFFALGQIARAVGLEGRRMFALLALAALSAAFYGDTAVGRDELLVGLFTHTALAQAVALLSLAWLVRGRPVAACIAAGLALDLNAMVGVWQAAPIAAVALVDLARKRAPLGRWAGAAAAFALTAAPVVAWILSTQSFAPTTYDYREFLQAYYPFHFFIGWAPWPQRIVLALQALGGLAALRFLPGGRVRAGAALTGLLLLFAGGAVVDQVTRSRFILDLHLLRADGMIAWTAGALMAAAAVSALSARRAALVPGGLVTVVGLAAGQWWLATAGVGLLWGLDHRDRRRGPVGGTVGSGRLAGPVMGALAAGLAALAAMVGGLYAPAPRAPAPGAAPTDAQLAGLRPAAPEWLAVGQWARETTPAAAVFLAPWKLDFTVVSERRGWVGWKEGATGLWAPSTYPLWRSRGAEVRALHDAAAQLAYACRRRIDYVIFDRRPGQALPGAAAAAPRVYANRWFSVVKVAPCPD